MSSDQSNLSSAGELRTAYGEPWDKEWADDWSPIVDIYNTIDHLERIFNVLEVSELRKLTQRQLILNLRKYAYTLGKIIIDKYSG